MFTILCCAATAAFCWAVPLPVFTKWCGEKWAALYAKIKG